MKNTFLILALILFSVSLSAQKYTTKTGNLKFEASVPSFEEVAAENKSVSAVLEAGTGNLAVLGLVKGFRFKVALMEEHFNENYIESDKYPKTTFNGKIAGFDLSKISDKASSYTISGDLTLHGVTKKVSTSAKISKKDGAIVVMGNFKVKPGDFNIEVPSAVSKKVAKEIDVKFSFSLSK